MSAMASQITSLTIVYSTVYSGADQRKHQSSAPLAFVRLIHQWPLNFPHTGPVTRKMFPFDDVIMRVVIHSPTIQTVIVRDIFIDLKERGKYQMWWEIIARNVFKCYSFYNETLFARQNQGWNFLISEPPGLNHTPVVVTCFSSFGIFGLVWKASHWDGMYWIISCKW